MLALVRACPLGILAAALISGAAQPASTPWLEAHVLPSPAAAGSAQPQLTTSSRGVLLSWIERSGGTTTLKFAERTPSGWSATHTVATGPNLFVNWADVPSVIRLRDGSIAAHWLQKRGQDGAYDLRLAYSKDDGRTWAASFLPHHDGTNTEHGFASLLQMPGAGLGLVWLDGRAMTGGHGSPGGHAEGEMSLRFGLFDTRWAQTADAAIDARVCECCPTAAAVTSDGPIVAYRNRGGDETRDIHISRYEHGRWTEPRAAHHDGWKIRACPVNGPALSARGRDLVLAWFTATNDRPQVNAAFSSDAGRTFGAPIRLDEGLSNGRVDVELLRDGSAVATYIEYADRQPRLKVRRIDRAGVRSPAVAIAALEDGIPRMAIHGDELVFAYVERGESLQVKTAIATLPR
jgi:hypothetical protein